MFAIPYEEDFTLIGTTDADHSDPGQKPECSAEEQAYLLNFANQYFAAEVTAKDVPELRKKQSNILLLICEVQTLKYHDPYMCQVQIHHHL